MEMRRAFFCLYYSTFRVKMQDGIKKGQSPPLPSPKKEMTLDDVPLHAIKGHFRSLLVSNIIFGYPPFVGCLLPAYRDSLKPLYLFSNETVVSFLLWDLQKAHALWLVTHGCFAKVIHFSDPKGRSIYMFSFVCLASYGMFARGSSVVGRRLISDHFAVFLPGLRVKAYDSDAIGTYLLVFCKPDGLRVHWLVPPRWIWLSPSHQLYMGLYLLCCDYSIAYFRSFCNTIFAQISQKVFVHDVKNWH